MTTTNRQRRDRAFETFVEPETRAMLARVVQRIHDNPGLLLITQDEMRLALRCAAFVHGLVCQVSADGVQVERGA